MAAKEIRSVGELIEVLGGPKATGDILGATDKMVVNWRARGFMPSRLYLTHKRKLAQFDILLPAFLWRMEEPERAA